MNTKERSIRDIALDIKMDWKKIHPTAIDNLNAMLTLEKITDEYYYDTAKSIVCYFLAQASTWRGEKARTIKKELKQMCGI